VNKSARIGMRIDPEKKDQYAIMAKSWGYSGISAFLEAMADWAIAYEKYEGDYQAYVAAEGNNNA
jgi:uncharacterized protein YjdB